MAKDTILRVRVTRQQLHDLLTLAHDGDTTVSAVIRAALDAYTVRDS